MTPPVVGRCRQESIPAGLDSGGIGSIGKRLFPLPNSIGWVIQELYRPGNQIERVTEGIVSCIEGKLPIPLLPKREDYLIACELLSSLDYVTAQRDDPTVSPVKTIHTAKFNLHQLSMSLLRISRAFSCKTVEEQRVVRQKLEDSLELFGWSLGYLSPREAQALFLLNEGLTQVQVRKLFGYKSTSSVANLADRAALKARKGIRTFIFYTVTSSNVFDLLRVIRGMLDYVKGNDHARQYFKDYEDELTAIGQSISLAVEKGALYIPHRFSDWPIFVRSTDSDFVTEKDAGEEIGIEEHSRHYVSCVHYGKCVSFAHRLVISGEAPGWIEWLSSVCPKRHDSRCVCLPQDLKKGIMWHETEASPV
jgi:hypothetical protein